MGISEGYEVRIVVLVAIVFMKIICKSFRGILWRCYFFLIVEQDIRDGVEFIVPDGVYFIPYDIIEGILCFIDDVKFCQDNVLLFFVMKRAGL